MGAASKAVGQGRKQGPVVRTLALCFLALMAGSPVLAAVRCEVCGNAANPAWRTTRGDLICGICIQIKEVCSICGLPALAGFSKTGDGRIICLKDAPNAVLTQTAAESIFEEARTGVLKLSNGSMGLRNPKVRVTLSNSPHWNYDNGRVRPEDLRTKGTSRTTSGPGGFNHEVEILSGLPRNQALGVAAHEYTHLWLNETLAPGRKLEASTTEGFCEMVTWKLMEARRDEAEQQRIRGNPYTRGRVETLLEYERLFGFSRLLAWTRFGTTPTVERSELERLEQHSADSGSAPDPGSADAAGGLRLMAITGPPESRVAMVNNVLLAPGDEGTISVEGRQVMVHCDTVSADAVTLRLKGTSRKQVLRFGGSVPVREQ